MNGLTRGALGALLLMTGVSCADLDIANPNDPLREDVVTSPADLENLIGGSFQSWWTALHDVEVNILMSNAAFQHTGTPANFGQVERSAIPRTPIGNTPADAFASTYLWVWDRLYRSISGANDGLVGLADTQIAGDEARTQRARAFAKFMQGVSHGYLALIYDQAFIVPETFRYNPEATPAEQGLDLAPYGDVMEAAYDFLDSAIELAEAHDFEIPDDWVPVGGMPSSTLAQLAHSYKARFRAEVARTEEERALVDWDQVVADVDAGMTADFTLQMNGDSPWANWYTYYGAYLYPAWSKVSYMIMGMADQSGQYQEWIGTPLSERMPIDIVTPDQRFPQGATAAEQQENDGLYILYYAGGQGNPERGTWRWSNYADYRWDAAVGGYTGATAVLTVKEMSLLKAEALYRAEDFEGAAGIINETRVTNGGLSAADSDGTNASCVPKLRDESCGDLWEQLKWEKRIELFQDRFGSWYFDSRGWGDLVEGSFLDMPVPARDLQNFGIPLYTTGGLGGNRAAGTSNYDFGPGV